MRLLTFIAFCFFSSLSFSQTYPAKPIRVIVGFPPGGSGDFLNRLMVEELGKELGAPVVAENRAGAGGNIATAEVARAAPDGYTVLNAPDLSCNRALYKSPGYELKDFSTITKIATGATVLVVHPSQPFKSLKDLVDYSKANPGKLFNASAGFCSGPHLAYALFESVAGVKFTSVQFKGGGPAAQSVLSGDTNMMFATSPTVMGFIKAGRLRPLAISRPQASPAIPGIPGAQEAGVPGYEYNFWFGLYVPAGTPQAIIRRLHEAATKALAKPELREKIALQGMDPTPSASPEAFDAEAKAEARTVEKLIRESGAKVE